MSFLSGIRVPPTAGTRVHGCNKGSIFTSPPLPQNAKILDVGCGSGTQTRDLAAHPFGAIIAVDNPQPFLDAIDARAEKEGYGGRIKTRNASMDALPFGKGEFDLIWSEGAIFIMGFLEGLHAWKPLLKKGGYMVVSDAAWFEPEPPAELMQWWEMEGYIPKTEDQLMEQVRDAGLHLIATYRLREEGW